MTSAAEPRASRLPHWVRQWAPLVLLGLLLAVGLLTRQPSRSDLPLDPASAQPNGTKALTLILDEAAGASVDVLAQAPAQDFDTVLVLVDNLPDEDAEQLLGSVDQGTVLVVTDPGGALTPRVRPARVANSGLGDLKRNCELPALRDAAEVDSGGGPLLAVPEGAIGCFGDERGAWLVAQSRGAGVVITTAGSGWLTNRGIREADNAVLATAVLAPARGSRVGIVRPDFAAATGGGAATLTDLIPRSVRLAILQLLVAFGLVVLWRGRRLGKPLSEPQPVRLAGSELVVAVGHMFQRTGARGRAADLLRTELRSVLAKRFGVDGQRNAAELAAAVAASIGSDQDTILEVLDGPEPRSDEELVLFAQRAESILSAVVVPLASGENRVHNE